MSEQGHTERDLDEVREHYRAERARIRNLSLHERRQTDDLVRQAAATHRTAAA